MQPTRVHLVQDSAAKGRAATTSESVRLFVDDALCIERNTLHAGRVQLHYHACYELEIVLDGCAENLFLDHGFDFTRGAVVVLSQAEVHRLTCEEHCEILSLKLSAPQEILQTLHYPFCARLSEEKMHFVERHLCLLEEELSAASSALQPLLARNFASWLLPFVLLDAKAAPLPASPQHHRMLMGLQYIRSHYREPITLHDVAAHCGYSDNHFGLRFREMTGSTFREALCAQRLQYASSLLTQSQLTIAEISAKSGFDSPAYFARCFAAAYGCTPSEYRQNR